MSRDEEFAALTQRISRARGDEPLLTWRDLKHQVREVGDLPISLAWPEGNLSVPDWMTVRALQNQLISIHWTSDELCLIHTKAPAGKVTNFNVWQVTVFPRMVVFNITPVEEP
jgi:hypothetical protein